MTAILQGWLVSDARRGTRGIGFIATNFIYGGRQ